MKTRRDVLAAIGTAAIGMGTASGSSTNDEEVNPTDIEITPNCAWCRDSDSKTTWKWTRQGDLELRSWARDEEPRRFRGTVEARWHPLRLHDANKIRLFVDVTASGYKAKIKDAPARFRINGNTASLSATRRNRNRFRIEYGWVYGDDRYCGPDMKHKVQAVVYHDSGQERESHSLNPC